MTYLPAAVPGASATASLNLRLTNPNSSLSLSGIGFTDALPAGQVVSTPNGLSGSCGGGTITATAGSGNLNLAGATLTGGAACNFSLNVLATASGTQNNTTAAVTSNESGNGGTASATLLATLPSHEPAEPTDITPISGDTYYVVNQLSGLQADNSSGATVEQEPKSFISLNQRWTFTLAAGFWQISNAGNGQCLGASGGAGVQSSCTGSTAQQWSLAPTAHGYYSISNRSTSQLMDVASADAGAMLSLSALSGSPSQSQQWLLRPSYFRGVDNALLEKQEATRIFIGAAWWKDTGGVERDLLRILKNHGINLVRVRPTSAPPYSNPSQLGCSGNACTGETEAQDLDLAKRVKGLGLSLELTVFFDGGNSATAPDAWAGHTIAQLQTDIHDYVKAEILRYRQQGTMPDLVSIGNEVNTGFLTGAGNVSNATFSDFAALQKAGMQGVMDAAADTSMGPAIPPPLTCIHITPEWPMTDFFTRVASSGVPYDVICQSYYPFFHGPLFTTQSNPGGQPVEESVLNTAASSLGKPILILETGEHYANGFESNDPWYSPSPANQAQFLCDLDGVQKALPNNLGMGITYWDPAGVDLPRPGGGLFNGGTSQPDSIYVWNGLTIFDNSDSSVLPGLDSLGGRCP